MFTATSRRLPLDFSFDIREPTVHSQLRLPKHTTRAWEDVHGDISTISPARSRDHDFWWYTTGVTLAILLQEASYSDQDQSRYLKLYYSAIIPELGVGACRDGHLQHWRSFMTDHHCPVEFSWEWNRKDELPVVRFSFEPISMTAGTKEDPFNRSSTLRFIHERSPWIPGCDLLWFQHLWNSLVSFERPRTKSRVRALEDTILITHESRSFLALDLNDTALILKAYYMPSFKARDTRTSAMSLIQNSIESLPDTTDDFRTCYNAWVDYLTSTSSGRQLTPEIVANDCVFSKDSRVKVYMRSPSTSLQSVLNTLCLERENIRNNSVSSIQEFRRLWCAVFGFTTIPNDDEELHFASHRTAGVLYYFELSPKKKLPSVKVYLPLRHWGGGDIESATRLQTFLRTTTRKDYSGSYIQALRKIISTSAFPKQHGFQTYLCAMLSGENLRLTSYLSPIVYRMLEDRATKKRKKSWPFGKRFSDSCKYNPQ